MVEATKVQYEVEKIEKHVADNLATLRQWREGGKENMPIALVTNMLASYRFQLAALRKALQKEQ